MAPLRPLDMLIVMQPENKYGQVNICQEFSQIYQLAIRYRVEDANQYIKLSFLFQDLCNLSLHACNLYK